MRQFIEFFEKNSCGFLATTEDCMPRVRPWSFIFEENGKFWFMTTNTKKVFGQLQKNPYIEFCSCSPDLVHGRLCGKVELYNDIRIKEIILEERPLLKQIYGSAENPVLESFYLEHGYASIYCSRLKINDFIEF